MHTYHIIHTHIHSLRFDNTMGVGCPNALSNPPFLRKDQSLPVLSMIVLGFPKSGKSALISRLAIDR
jgi:ribosome biogenesis GTPase A